MRQITHSEDGEKLQNSLENMRYKACTPEDIKFLHTRIAGDQPDRPKLAQKSFCNISIITTWNAHKDQINLLGSERFAEETGQTLTTFYAKDQWAEDDDSKKQRRWTKRAKKNPKRKSNDLNPAEKLPRSPGKKHSKRIMELTKRDTEIERVYIAEGYVGV